MRKPVFGGLQTIKAQTSLLHRRRLISAFVIHLLKSIISEQVQFSVAEETGLSLALSETPKTGFVAARSNYE